MSIESEIIGIIKPSEEEVRKIRDAADSLILEVKDYISRKMWRTLPTRTA